MASEELSPTAFRKLLARSVLVPPVLLGILALVFLGQILYLLSAAQWVDHTDQVIARANTLLKLLVDGETGLRGYLVTGDPVFLEPYHIEENNVTPAFVELMAFVSDNPSQVERLKALRTNHGDWQIFARKIIDLRRQEGDYQSSVRNGDGKRRMDAMREQVAAFVRVEEGLREARTQTAWWATWLIVGVSLGLALVVGGVMAFLTRRQLIHVSESYQSALSEVTSQAESLRRSAHRLEILHEIDRAILAAESVPELARSALRRMERVVPSQAALVVVFDAGVGPAQVISRSDQSRPSGTDDLAVSLAGISSPIFCERDSFHGITSLAEVAVRNAVQDSLFAMGHRSCVAAPLQVDARRFGVLVLADPGLSAFTDEHQEIADEVAQQIAIAFQQARLREQLQQHADGLEKRVAERTRELRETLESVKQLQGLLPICAWCKKVRDDKDYWHEVEHFVAARTDAQFTHGICPDCLKTSLKAHEQNRQIPGS